MSPTGTAPGAGYPVVWDTVGKRLLVVDSSGNVTAYSPTTNAWAALTTGTTKPSNNLGVAWDSTDGIVLQFGGGRSCNNGNCNDLWAYSPVAGTWTQLTATNPPGLRSNEQLVWDSVHNQLLVVDGSSYINGISTYYDDVWAYSVAQSRWQQLTVSGTHPAARWYADLIFDPTDDIALLFGGSSSTTSFLGDLSAYQPQALTLPTGPISGAPNAWSPAPTITSPLARYGGVSVWDPTDKVHFVFGGNGSGIGFLNDMWAYSPAASHWSQLLPASGSPTTSFGYYARGAWDSADGELLLCGAMTAPLRA